MAELEIADGDMGVDAAGKSHEPSQEQCPPDPSLAPTKAPHRDEQDGHTIGCQGATETGAVMRNQREEMRVRGAQDSRSGPQESQVRKHEYARCADHGNGDARSNEPDCEADEEELAGDAESPGDVVVKVLAFMDLFAGWQERREQQQRKQAGTQRHMQGIDVVEPQEYEEAGETDDAGSEQGPSRPQPAVAQAVECERQIQDADREHRGGQGDPVMAHEREKARVDFRERGPADPQKGLVVGKDDASQADHDDNQAGGQHTGAEQRGPEPSGT